MICKMTKLIVCNIDTYIIEIANRMSNSFDGVLSIFFRFYKFDLLLIYEPRLDPSLNIELESSPLAGSRILEISYLYHKL